MKSFLLPCLLLFLFSSATAQLPADISKLDSVLTQLNQTGRFNGTVLYAEGGKILYTKALGVADYRTGKPLSTHSSFNLASVSKQFMDMAVMILSEKGLIGLDDDIIKYLPGLPYKNITIRNLMTHTSGIPEYFELNDRYRQPLDTLTNEKMVELFQIHKPALDFETGTKWQYCNSNYVLLAAIIERISKEPIERFIDERICRPLQLHDTYVYYLLMPSSPENRVYGFSEVNGKRVLNDLIYTDGVTGDGNIYSSVEDLYRWEQSLYTEKLVKKTTLAQAFEPVKLKDGKTYPYGFGWFLDTAHSSYWHTGSWGGFRNLICRDTKRHRTLIVLTSGDNFMGRNAAKNVFDGKPYTIPACFLIRDVVLVDGSGIAARKAAVRVEGNRILAVGDLKPYTGETIVEGGGKTLVPGFIDSHSHVGGSLDGNPEALAALNQGVTTIVSGQDGSSDPIDSIKAAFLHTPRAINVATYTGHTTIRETVMGVDQLHRPATDAELEKIKTILKDELKKGSLGLSTGLEYEGSFYSNRNEVIELAKTTAAGGGRYISHIRNEDSKMPDAIDEIIDIGRQAKIPVQISHIKIAFKDNWGGAPALLAQLERARQEGINVTADCYPYEYWHSTIRVLFPKKDFTSLAGANFAVDHLFDPEHSVISEYTANPMYKGKTVSAIAAMRNETPAQTLLYLVAAAQKYRLQHPDAGGADNIISKSMSDEDVDAFLSWSHTSICSDGANGGHPRGYGTFTRVLGKYVREKKIMGFETAIHKMTALTAEQVGLKERGLIASGYFADLVLLDPEKVKDNSVIENSKALSDGILQVWVNGILVYKDLKPTHRYPGVFVSR